MSRNFKKIESAVLSIILVILMLTPGFSVIAADPTITITDEDGAEITEAVTVKEYENVKLKYVLSEDVPEDSTVEWESNLPLLAGVDENGKVTGYDYSKAAIIQLWLDEEVRPIPIVGPTTAAAIEKAIENSGYDLETVNTDLLVALVRGVAGDSIADSLKEYLDNMNVEVTATVYDADGNALCSDTVEILVTQSTVASVVPTGVHITNKKKVPLKVALGATVQLYGAVTPVRLKQGVKWSVDTSIFSGSTKNATVTDDGLVTFTGIGEAKIKVQPESTLYAAFSDSITFEVVDPSELPVTDFDILGTLSVNEGETTQLSIENLDPAGAYTGDIVWTTSDPLIAVVDATGLVTGLDGGSISKSVDITATLGEVTKTVSVTVKRSGITGSLSGIEIEGETVIANDTSSQYSSTLFPSRLNSNKSVVREWGLVDKENADNIVWATSETPAEISIASVDCNGLLTPKSSGVITLVAKATYNDSSVQTSIEITAGNAVTDFTITGKTSVTENSTIQLSIENIAPDDYDEALLSTVKWSSADPLIASVDENGVVKGLDAGGYGTFNSSKTTIYATISGVTRSFEITVKGAFINYVTSARIEGFDYVIKDFPVQYQGKFTPERLDITTTLWGLPTDEGEAPWEASNSLSKADNTENSIASVSSSGVVTGKEAGETTLHLFGRRLLTSHNETTKDITVVEIEPKSITVTPPSVSEYVEGDTELDLTDLKVELNYDRADIEQYYGDTSELYTDEQLRVEVTDYTVSEINQKILDTEQYIVISVVRAGKTFRGVFAITLASKDLTSIELTNPQYRYLEGAIKLDLSELKVLANYSNAESEYVTDYNVDKDAFDPTLYNEEQNITVSYSHADKTATATFPVIVYGIPVVSVDENGYDGEWTDKDVTFTLSSTNELDGATYYFRNSEDADWIALSGNTLTVNKNVNETYYFKAVNSANVESESTQGYIVKRDDVTPSFTLEKENEALTNQSYNINIKDLTVGISGVKSITLDGNDITSSDSFTVEGNGEYTVTVTANNALSSSVTVKVENIDKEAPIVNSVSFEHKVKGGIARIINTLTFGKFFNDDVEVTIDCEDVGVAGIDRVEYRLLDENAQPVSEGWSLYSESDKLTVTSAFRGYVQARAIDKAGNISSYLRSDGIVIDADIPTDVTVSATFNGEEYTDGKWVSDNVKIVLSSTAFSGIYEYLYRVDGGEWATAENGKVTADLIGEHKYEFKAVSNSDLESNITEFNVKIDKQLPVIRVDFKGTFGRWTSDDVIFTLSTMEESLSGITYYYTDGSGEWIEIQTGEEIALKENAKANYSFKAVNAAGTESPPSDAYYVMIDNVVPTLEYIKSQISNDDLSLTVNLTATTGESGIKKITVDGRDITEDKSFKVTANGTYNVKVFSNSGLFCEENIVIDDFDTVKPEINAVTFKQLEGNSVIRVVNSSEIAVFMNNKTEITVDASDDNSGIEKIEYRFVGNDGNTVGDWTEYNNLSKPSIESCFSGKIEARATDKAGNISSVYTSEKITVDVSAPSKVDINAYTSDGVYNGGYTDKSVKIELSSTAFSGIYQYEYRVDGGEWSVLKSNSLTALDGVHTYDFKSVSYSGLESEISSLTVKTDKSKPILSVTVIGELDSSKNDEATFVLSVSNCNSQVTYYYNDGSGFKALKTNILTVELCYARTYTFKAVTSAGLQSDVSKEYTCVISKNALEKIIEKAELISLTDATETSSENLLKAVADGKSVLENDDATSVQVSQAIEKIADAIDKVELKKIITASQSQIVIDRLQNEVASYMIGLTLGENSVDEIKDSLENKSVQIIIEKDGSVLADSELVGTGCVVKCVSSADPSVVYETATVILYGDVNGDGKVDETDTDILMSNAFGMNGIDKDSVYFIAGDLSKDGVIDMFDLFYADGISSGERNFDQTQTLYK